MAVLQDQHRKWVSSLLAPPPADALRMAREALAPFGFMDDEYANLGADEAVHIIHAPSGEVLNEINVNSLREASAALAALDREGT